MDREGWYAAIHGVAKSRKWLSNWTELNTWNYCNIVNQLYFNKKNSATYLISSPRVCYCARHFFCLLSNQLLFLLPASLGADSSQLGFHIFLVNGPSFCHWKALARLGENAGQFCLFVSALSIGPFSSMVPTPSSRFLVFPTDSGLRSLCCLPWSFHLSEWLLLPEFANFSIASLFALPAFQGILVLKSPASMPHWIT